MAFSCGGRTLVSGGEHRERAVIDKLKYLKDALRTRYAVQREVGRGGMATVYLAEDLKHHRLVALKVLRPELAAALGPDRFLREIEISAQLHHPHILPLYDSGEAEGLLYYVMPFVEGESLAERLAREGQLAIGEAVELARYVALALSYAHSLGVVHRDIKPGNILLSAGEPIVADFGVAKALTAAGQNELTDSGFVVGTVLYMSPEQASGERVLDGRTDLYALGCVLYEMLAGTPPFTGPSPQVVTARKLSEPIPSLRCVRESVSLELEQAVCKALARSPADRFPTGEQMADALGAALTTSQLPAASVPVRNPRHGIAWMRAVPWALAGGLAVAAGLFAMQGRGAGRELRLSVTTPRGSEVYGFSSAVAIAPNGETVVFSAGHGDSVRLYARRLDAFDVRPLPGTEGGDSPFFSPDGRWVGFFARSARQLRKVALAGGAPITIADDVGLHADFGAWGTNDTIYFSNYPEPQIRMVAAAGGAIAALTHGAPPNGNFRRAVHLLPDGRHALVTVTASIKIAHVDLVSLQTGEHELLLANALDARYDPRGYLLYLPNGQMEVAAVPFDVSTLRVTGDPVTVLDSVAVYGDGGALFFDVAANGTLAYVPASEWSGPSTFTRMVIVRRDGVVEPIALPEGSGPRFSPDGRRLVYQGPGRHTIDILTYDLTRGVEHRLTGDAGDDYWPIFTPDGRHVIFNSNRGGAAFVTLHDIAVDGAGAPRRLPTDSTMHQQPFTWTADGTALLYTRGPSATGMDIWMLSMTGGHAARPLMASAANETQPALSPDGQWLAWVTDATGRPEVLVRRFPDGPDVPVTRDGGAEPVWSPNGREIYFRDLAATAVMVASFAPGDPPIIGVPRTLFTGRFRRCSIWCRGFDVSPDGQRFAMMDDWDRMVEPGYWPAGAEIRIVPHWDRELRAKMREAASRD